MAIVQYLDTSFLVRSAMRQIGIFNCAPVKLADSPPNPNPHHVKFVKLNSREIRQLKLNSFLHSVAALISICQCFISSNEQSRSTFDIILGYFTLTLIGVTTFYLHLCRSEGTTWKIYLDNLLIMTKKLKSNKKPKTIDWLASLTYTNLITLLMVPMLQISFLGFPLIYIVGLHWTNPCKPSLILYYIIDECSAIYNFPRGFIRSFIGTFFKTIVFVGNIWVWYVGVHAALFVIAPGFLISPIVIRECIQEFRKRLRQTSEICAKAVQYRHFQVYNTIGNFLQQSCLGLFITALIICVSVVFGLLIASSRRVVHQSNSLLSAAFLVITIDGTLCILVLLGGLVLVYTESKRLLIAVKFYESTYTSRLDRRWARRFWRSCDILHIKFGDSNFLEELTPLRCYDCVLNFTVQILLLSSNK